MPASTTNREALSDDLRVLDFAHSSLDEIGVPRANGDGQRLTLFGRIEALRAGRFDPARLSPRGGAAPAMHRCPRCGLMVLVELGETCPSCSAELNA
jgi:rubrerythrin